MAARITNADADFGMAGGPLIQGLDLVGIFQITPEPSYIFAFLLPARQTRGADD